MNANDLSIAATAAAHSLAVVTQDDGFDAWQKLTGTTSNGRECADVVLPRRSDGQHTRNWPTTA